VAVYQFCSSGGGICQAAHRIIAAIPVVLDFEQQALDALYMLPAHASDCPPCARLLRRGAAETLKLLQAGMNSAGSRDSTQPRRPSGQVSAKVAAVIASELAGHPVPRRTAAQRARAEAAWV